mgnify:CR=1 FL=1
MLNNVCPEVAVYTARSEVPFTALPAAAHEEPE